MMQFGRFFKVSIFIAIVLLSFGINGHLKMSAIAQRGVAARASVNKIYEGYYSLSRLGGRFPYVDLTFTDAKGKIHKISKFMLDKDLKDLSEGDEFDILYDSSYPGNAIAKARLKGEIIIYQILIILGTIFLIFELFTARRSMGN